jgi:hypothetical protein
MNSSEGGAQVMWVHCTLYEQKEKTEEGPVGQLFTS